jgi:sugar lactone lactonase YvrE
MKTHNTLTALGTVGLFALASSACGGSDCHTSQTIDRALEEMCRTDGGTTTTTACTPAMGTICSVAGTGLAGFSPNGTTATQAQFYLPQDTTVGPDGNLYIVDWNNHVIRRLEPNGTITTVAGSGELSDGDSTPESMPSNMPGPALDFRLNHPANVEFDGQGRMLIAAWHNSSIKRVDLRTGILDTLCGTGARGYFGDEGPAPMAQLNLPVGVAINPMNAQVYIADQGNQRVRTIDGADVIHTVAGNGTAGFGGDGAAATMAQISNPVGQAALPAGRIVFDTSGNLYIADTGNHRVRKVDPSGVITTVAGNGNAGTNGDNGPATMAELNGPTDVEIAPDGTLYIADTQNSCVRAVRDGMISTVAGHCGTRGTTGDGADPAMALLDRPFGVETDSSGNLYIADTYNHRIRLVCLTNAGRCAHN